VDNNHIIRMQIHVDVDNNHIIRMQILKNDKRTYDTIENRRIFLKGGMPLPLKTKT
jgi:hypothetical protein